MTPKSRAVKRPAAEPQLSAAWSPFAQKLAAVLAVLEEDQYLVIAAKHSNRFVQFAAQGSFGMRAETASNCFLAKSDQLSTAQVVALADIGWTAPTGTPEESTPECQPDGSPNFFAEFQVPVSFSTIAQLAVCTLADVLRIPHPGYLAYEAFDADGKAILLPTLGLKHAAPVAVPESQPDSAQLLLKAVRERTDLADLNFDGDGDITLRYGSVAVSLRLVDQDRYVRILSLLVLGIHESPELLSRLNEINVNLRHSHLYLREDTVLAVSSLPVIPFVAEHVVEGLEEFCQMADGMDNLLQGEFGGRTSYTDSMPSSLKH